MGARLTPTTLCVLRSTATTITESASTAKSPAFKTFTVVKKKHLCNRSKMYLKLNDPRRLHYIVTPLIIAASVMCKDAFSEELISAAYITVSRIVLSVRVLHVHYL